MKWKKPQSNDLMISQKKLTPYTSNHVNILYNMIKKNTTMPFEMICFTDDAKGIKPEIKTLPIWNQYPERCYRRLKLFSLAMQYIIGKRFICFDLDMVIVRNIDHILNRKENFIIYRRKPYRSDIPIYNGSLFMMDAGARDSVWREFTKNPEQAKIDSSYLLGSDQAWIQHHLGENEAYWDRRDGIADIRHENLKNLPNDVCMVVTPGGFDPNQPELRQQHKWIETYYR